MSRQDPGRTKVYTVLRPAEVADGIGGKTRVPTAAVGRKERGRITPVVVGEHIFKERGANKTTNIDLVGTFRFGANIELDDVLQRGTFQARVVGIKNPGDRGHVMQINLSEVQGAPQTS